MGDVFAEWNKGELDSYLIEITAAILKFKDADGTPLVEKIRDTAGQKGTGKWTGIEALEPACLTLIGDGTPPVEKISTRRAEGDGEVDGDRG